MADRDASAGSLTIVIYRGGGCHPQFFAGVSAVGTPLWSDDEALSVKFSTYREAADIARPYGATVRVRRGGTAVGGETTADPSRGPRVGDEPMKVVDDEPRVVALCATAPDVGEAHAPKPRRQGAMMRINLAPRDPRPRGSGVGPKLRLPRWPAFDLGGAFGVLYFVTVLAVLALGAFWWHLPARQAELASAVQRQTTELAVLEAEIQRQTTDLAALEVRVDQIGKIEETLIELRKRLDAIRALGKGQSATARLNDVVVQQDAGAIAVHLRMSLVPRYRVSFIDTPWRLVIDMDGVTFGWRGGPLDLDVPPLRQVRGSQFRKDVTRVVIEFTGPANYAIHEEPAGLVILVPIVPASRRG